MNKPYVVLEDRLNFENAHEENDVVHPLENMTIQEIKDHIADLERWYAGYEGLHYEKCWKSFGYGAMTGWYELRGYPLPLTKALREPSEF